MNEACSSRRACVDKLPSHPESGTSQRLATSHVATLIAEMPQAEIAAACHIIERQNDEGAVRRVHFWRGGHLGGKFTRWRAGQNAAAS